MTNINNIYSGIFKACLDGDLEEVKSYIESDKKYLEEKDNWGKHYTPLIIASDYGHLNIVKYLIEQGANVNNGTCYTYPLNIACYKGHFKVAKYLVKNGANLTQTALIGTTPLHNASWCGHLEIVEFLISKGADINIVDDYNKTPFHSAVHFNNLNVVKFFVEKKAVSLKDPANLNCIHRASFRGHFEMVKYLLSLGQNINKQNEDGHTPLIMASKYKHLNIVEYLIKKGANKNKRNKEGKSAYDYLQIPILKPDYNVIKIK